MTMIDYDKITKRWDDFVSIATTGYGPWKAEHSKILGWVVRNGESRIIKLFDKKEAIAVCAALNAVSVRSKSP